jgi:hypothetical protein
MSGAKVMSKHTPRSCHALPEIPWMNLNELDADGSNLNCISKFQLQNALVRQSAGVASCAAIDGTTLNR